MFVGGTYRIHGRRFFLPVRRSKRGICYGNVAGWLAGWLSVTAGIVSKGLNLS